MDMPICWPAVTVATLATYYVCIQSYSVLLVC